MLDELRVQNLGLIPEARIEPGPGLVVITGETGAGKTLLLGALRLIKGEPARKDQIGPTGDEASVEARLVVDDEEHVVTRRIDRSRSRAYLDGTMVTASAVADRFAGLIDIVGQHDRNALADPTAIRGMIDAALDRPGTKARTAYQHAWTAQRELEARIEELGGDRRSLERELDMVRFQGNEIAGAGFASGDDAELERVATRLRNAESLGERLAAASEAIGEYGAESGLERGLQELIVAAKTDPSLQELVGLGREAAVLLGELSAEIAGITADFERDPEQLVQVEARLALMGDLKRKYGDDLDAVLAFGAEATASAERLEGLLGSAGELEDALRDATAAVAATGSDLRDRRARAGGRLAKGAAAHLADLGFSDPVVRFRVENAQPGPKGADQITLEFSSDTSLEAKPASRIASGGELSRLVLALRLAAGVADATVIAFDEIDAGTGGETALAMGRKLADLSKGKQVFCVTHLPQVAAFADHHLAVRREGTTASVVAVDGDARIEELSRMLAGLPESDRGKEHAAELLVLASSR